MRLGSTQIIKLRAIVVSYNCHRICAAIVQFVQLQNHSYSTSVKFSNNPSNVVLRHWKSLGKETSRSHVHVSLGRIRKEREPPLSNHFPAKRPPDDSSPKSEPPQTRIVASLPDEIVAIRLRGSRLRESIRKSLLLYFPQVERGQAANQPKRERERERKRKRERERRKREREGEIVFPRGGTDPSDLTRKELAGWD